MASADSLLVAAATSPTAPAASSPLEALYDAQQQAVLRPLPAPAAGRRAAAPPPPPPPPPPKPDDTVAASQRAAHLLHAALGGGGQRSNEITAAACKLPLRTFASVNPNDASAVAQMCAERAATGWEVVCVLLALVLAGWVYVATDTANKQAAAQQPVTVWVPPPWIVVLPLLVAVYLHFFLPQSAAVSMTAEQLEFALTGMNFHDYLSYKNGRDSVAASGLASAGGLLTSFQYGTSFAPL
jgi:hypothetical protein